MTRQLPDRAEQVTGVADTGWPPEGEGQLPFSLRIGVTGHRRLTDPAALVPGIRAAVQGVVERFLGPEAEPALLVISALAEGADRLVAAEVLARPDATMEAVLPLPPGDYLDDFTGDASKAEFTAENVRQYVMIDVAWNAVDLPGVYHYRACACFHGSGESRHEIFTQVVFRDPGGRAISAVERKTVSHIMLERCGDMIGG